jgi:fructoselysine-6-P-deglycase FrlB-like protein
VLYTVGSGAAWGSAYMECICILMEMQWIHSNCIHSGEFFHGPLEIVDTETPFLLMMGDGSTRELDERVKTFLEKWDESTPSSMSRIMGLMFWITK